MHDFTSLMYHSSVARWYMHYISYASCYLIHIEVTQTRAGNIKVMSKTIPCMSVSCHYSWREISWRKCTHFDDRQIVKLLCIVSCGLWITSGYNALNPLSHLNPIRISITSHLNPGHQISMRRGQVSTRCIEHCVKDLYSLSSITKAW